MKCGGEVGEAGRFHLYGRANCGSCGNVGKPKVNVFVDDVVENGDPTFMGGEVWSEDGDTNACVLGAYVCKNIIEVVALVKF